MKTFICGHKNPDTDSIISAIALAQFLGAEYEPARAGELNKETEYILDRFSLSIPELLAESVEKIVLVDHNSPEETSELVIPEKIKAVYDHHKLCGIFTNEAVPVRIEPIGSTCTLVTKIYRENDKKPEKDLAAALLCGILSDTLNFTSPTTTEVDKNQAQWLNGIAGLDIESTAQAMFMAKSDISDVKTKELLTKDYKVFDMSGQKVGVGVWETVLPDAVTARKAEIEAEMKAEKEKSKLDYIFFAAIDIMNQAGYFFIAGEKEQEVLESVFGTKEANGLVAVPGVVSRKKQIVPPLEKYFA